MERTFWIQGRTGRYWQNLESLDNDQAAIVRLGTLISEDRYDELRLVQAQISAITGETDYTNIVTIRDGQVIDSPMLRAQQAAEAEIEESDEDRVPVTSDEIPTGAPPGYTPGYPPHGMPQQGAPVPGTPHHGIHMGGYDPSIPESANIDPEHHPQLRFWPNPNPENMQGRLGLSGENHWEADPSIAHSAAPEEGIHPHARRGDDTSAPKQGRRKATFVPHVTVHSGPLDEEVMAGGWKIPKGYEDEASQTAGQNNPQAGGQTGQQWGAPLPDEMPSGETMSFSGTVSENISIGEQDAYPRSTLTADPDGREGGSGRRARRIGMPRFGGARRGPAQGNTQENRGSTTNRVALMSGVFAGALATGLALSAINPDFAGRFFAGVSSQVGDFLPKTNLIAAIENGDLQTVRARLAEGSDPNAVDEEGNPALLRAARSGNLAAVSLLLQAGADPTLPTQDGRSVLHRIAAEGRSQAMQRMIDAGAPVDLAGGTYGCLTPLSVASANGRVRAASLLAERGASLEPQNGCTVGPMEIAASHPHVLARLEQVRAERTALLHASGAVPTEEVPAPRPGTALVTAQIDDPVPPGATAPEVLQAPTLPPTAMEAPPRLEPEWVDPSDIQAPGDVAQDLVDAAEQAPPAEEPLVSDEVIVADAGPAENGVFMPPSKPTEPEIPPMDPRIFTAQLKNAIDARDEGTVVALLGSPPPGFQLDDARYAIEDGFGSGVRTALEQAALTGQEEIVRLLTDDGASIPPKLIHRIVQHADRPDLANMLGVLLEEGADPNGLSDGLTPLMRAALRGDPETAYMLMAFGASPNAVSADGRLASDFAREAGRADLEERLVLAAGEGHYRDLMMGLSWSDTLASVRNRVEVCKDIGDDFTACKLQIDTWVGDAKVVVAQFDRKASDRLVAIQIDSQPFGSARAALAQFEIARRAIQERVPTGHAGFMTSDIASMETLFNDLRPEVNRGRYFSYWPDQDRRRPVFVHLKLAGLDENAGFYRIVIGNPFRAS